VTRLTHGMVMAAGLGTRMRPLTLNRPKPLLVARGRTLLDHALDELAAAGVNNAVVNVHYLAGQVIAHVTARQNISVRISDEQTQLLDTGGGVRKALPHLGKDVFAVLNSDNVWLTDTMPALSQLLPYWNDARMDALMLLVPREQAIGYDRAGDFEMDGEGRLSRRRGTQATYVWASIQLCHPRLFANTPEGPFSTNFCWDRAIAAGRLFGHVLDGRWCDVGTPAALDLVNALPD
jgi:N-acetyl-alpha-D-muramate 1-phosphate uridylyltransferase